MPDDRPSFPARPVAPVTLSRLKAACDGWLETEADTERYRTAWRDGWRGTADLVLRPKTTEEVARLVRICAETRTPIVPQSGNTGLTGGGQPHAGGGEVILSTERLREIRAVDPLDDAMIVEAGVTLAEAQAEAEKVDRLFPLSLAAEGTCCIGGNVATNAGGVQVLRYGTMRALVLGLEVVTAEGEIWDGLRTLRKDNAGYDLKQLFIGSEGTLGIVTAAALRLFPRPKDAATALLSLPSAETGVRLLAALKSALGERLTAFELMHPSCFDWATETLGHADPLPGAGWRALIQADGPGPQGAMREALEQALAGRMEAGEVLDGVLAETVAQADALWRIREDQAEVQKRVGAGVKHDVSVPVPRIPAFLEAADAALEARFPGTRPCTFGHLGDGNLHYNPVRPADMDDAAWRAATPEVNAIVHDLVARFGGSITAEHGVGRLRRAELGRVRSGTELDLMRRVKRALDPQGLLNPGKVLPD
ncbi:MAG: FAD-binding oxidoreductase [Pseudomonadota bacterium]